MRSGSLIHFPTVTTRAMSSLSHRRSDGVISLSVVSPQMKSGSWDFAEFPGVVPDSVNHKHTMPEVYLAADARFTGRVTVPVLWDRLTKRIVNNSEDDLCRMFDGPFAALGHGTAELFPREIDAAPLGLAHGARHEVRPGLAFFDSYHCSRYNTNTGRLTPAMFHTVLQSIRDHLGAA